MPEASGRDDMIRKRDQATQWSVANQIAMKSRFETSTLNKTITQTMPMIKRLWPEAIGPDDSSVMFRLS